MSDILYSDLVSNRTIVPLSDLVEWEDNPKYITDDDFEQLRKDIHRRQFKPLIVTPIENGKALVLGGNQRYRAMYAEDIQRVWVSIVDFKQDGDGFIAYVNGEVDKDENDIPIRFKSKKDGMIHYALKDNEERGKHDESALQELVFESGLELSDYKVNMIKPVVLKELVERVTPTPSSENAKTTEPVNDEDDNDSKPLMKRSMICPKCGEEFEI